MTTRAPAIVIAGPTASGKSRLGVALASRLGGAVINADSMQVYRELSVITARPTPADMAGIPHEVYGVMSAREACSAARWRDMVGPVIRETLTDGRVPILVGGSGLYFRALIEGLAPVPHVPRSVRREAEARFDREGARAFHAQLKTRDPVMADRLLPSDRQRMIRAWEVISATGRSLAVWQSLPADPPMAHPVLKIVVQPDRRDLYAACDRRFVTMMAAGALDEVAELEAMGLDPGLPAMKALGVPSLRRLLRGELDRDEAVTRAQRATRHYAKRQTTWFRHQMSADLAIPEVEDHATDRAYRAAAAFVESVSRQGV